jgi:hypothetical protein
MTRELAGLDLLLSGVEKNCSSSDYERAWIPFMFECVDLISARMPEVGHDSLEIGKAFAAKQLGAEQLDEAIRRCWDWCDARQKQPANNEPEWSAVRAVLCILITELQPDPREFLDTTSFFLQLLLNVEPCSRQLDALIKKSFVNCLSA